MFGDGVAYKIMIETHAFVTSFLSLYMIHIAQTLSCLHVFNAIPHAGMSNAF